MKEATGELNMTVVTLIAVGAVIGLFWLLWPTISTSLENTWNKVAGNNTGICPAGQTLVNGVCTLNTSTNTNTNVPD